MLSMPSAGCLLVPTAESVVEKGAGQLLSSKPRSSLIDAMISLRQTQEEIKSVSSAEEGECVCVIERERQLKVAREGRYAEKTRKTKGRQRKKPLFI